MQIGNRIIVLGCSGSGKSTFSRKLHEKTGLPLIHLDNIWWKEDRSHITRDKFDRELDKILKGDKWIIDGDFSRTYEVRFIHCDTVIFLDYSFDVCMKGIMDRVGKDRPDIPWTEQKLDSQLVKLVEDYSAENRPAIISLLEKYSDKKQFIFRTREEADVWIEHK